MGGMGGGGGDALITPDSVNFNDLSIGILTRLSSRRVFEKPPLEVITLDKRLCTQAQHTQMDLKAVSHI